MLQVRGSVPLFWGQSGLTAQTAVTRNALLTANAFERHLVSQLQVLLLLVTPLSSLVPLPSHFVAPSINSGSRCSRETGGGHFCRKAEARGEAEKRGFV